MILYKRYPWINPFTGREPITGDEFLYHFYTNKNDPTRIFLCIEPSVHPIKKHPFGFLGLIGWILSLTIGDSLGIEFILIPIVFTIFSIISGSIFSFFTYIFYYLNERKWKQQVIDDWKSDKLRYKQSESELTGINLKPIDESKFF